MNDLKSLIILDVCENTEYLKKLTSIYLYGDKEIINFGLNKYKTNEAVEKLYLNQKFKYFIKSIPVEFILKNLLKIDNYDRQSFQYVYCHDYYVECYNDYKNSKKAVLNMFTNLVFLNETSQELLYFAIYQLQKEFEDVN